MTIKTFAIAFVAVPLLIQPLQAATYNTLSGEAPKIIAHRGASGYLPEHTLAAYELAARLGADYIEPDVVITSDGVAIALHDTSLERTTNVEDLFPGRASYEASDFTLAEIKSLTVDYVPAKTMSVSALPDFVPSAPDAYKVPTLKEVVDLVTSYNSDNGTDIGLYPELKTASPALNLIIVQTLIDAGFDGLDDNVYIQSFDLQTLRDVAVVQADLGSSIPQIALGAAQVIGADGYLIRSLTDGALLADIASFVDGVGPSLFELASAGIGVTEEFVRLAHDLGLEVHPYTFRDPIDASGIAQLQEYFDIGIDGFFTDFTDVGRAAVGSANVVAPVPLPASGMLGLWAIGAFAWVGRRRA